MNYKYSLDKSSKKFICPACDRRKLVRYKDNETKKYLNDLVGKCDRYNNCNYHFSPKSFFEKNGEKYSRPKGLQKIKTNHIEQPERYSVHHQENIMETLMSSSIEKNDFIIFLYSTFGRDITNKLINRFFIGTFRAWGKYTTVFWQININGEIRAGKIMAYNSKTGKRVKGKDKPLITWYHSELKKLKSISNFQLKQCLYGEHQLNTEPKDKVIGIVESEKTAIIMTVLMPSLIWMACGSLHQIKKEIFLPIADRLIVLFPDLNGFDKWNEKAKKLKEFGFNISVDSFLEKNTTEKEKEEGFDLVDFFLKRDENFEWALTEKNYPLFWDK